MTARLLLVRHGTSAETRAGAFAATSGSARVDGCAPLDAGGRASAAALRSALPRADRVWSSFAERALATARAAGLEPEPTAVLAEADFGSWSGRTPAEVAVEAPSGLEAWAADLEHPPHGGEPLSSVRERARTVLERCGGLGGTTIAVTHGGLIRAALLEALDLPEPLFWRFDVAPASVTVLHGTDGWWRLVRLSWAPRLAGAVPLEAAS